MLVIIVDMLVMYDLLLIDMLYLIGHLEMYGLEVIQIIELDVKSML